MSVSLHCGLMKQDLDPGVAEAVLRAFAQGDTTEASAVVGDGTLLHVSGASGLSGSYHGMEAIHGLLRQLADLTSGTFRLVASVTSPETDGRRTVVEGRAEAVRRRRQLSTAVRLVMIGHGAEIREIWLNCEDQGEFDDFWE